MCQPHRAVTERLARENQAESRSTFLACTKFGHKIPSKINRYGPTAHNNLNRNANFSQLISQLDS